jgi:hypothetical protein
MARILNAALDHPVICWGVQAAFFWVQYFDLEMIWAGNFIYAVLVCRRQPELD